MQTIQLKNTNISEDLSLIESTLEKYGYEPMEIKRYSLLTEEALLKWKEALGEETEALFDTKETRNSVKFTFTVKGKKVYPFEQKEDSIDFLSKMHDRLLEGTGCEFRYSHFGNNNNLSLSLPKKNHEEKLFYKNMVFLAVPVAMQWLLTTIITATDSILMGLIDQSSLSAISMTSALMDLFNIIITALVTGTTIYASQYWGRRDREGIRRVFRVSVLFSGLISALFFIPSFFFPQLIMRLYTDIPDLIAKGSMYLRLVSPMFICAAFYQIYYAILKNTGKVLRFAVYMVIATIVDFTLNIILVFGYFGFPALGIKGAAFGTLTAAVLQFVVCLVDALSSRDIQVFKKTERAGLGSLASEYIRKSLSAGAQMVSWTLANNIIISIFGHMGPDIVAASGVVNIISEMGIFAAAGLYNTSGILVGNKLGNNKLEEAKIYSLRYLNSAFIVGIFTALGILLLNLNVHIMPLNISEEAFGFVHIMLYVVAFELLFKALNCIMNYGGFYAGGDTVPLLIIDTINMWLIMVPVGLICLYVLHFPAIVVAILLHCDEFTSFPFKYSRYRKFKWVRNISKESN